MKLQGIVSLVFKDKDTNEITKKVEVTNHIQNWWLRSTLLNSYQKTVGSVVFISEENPNKQSREWNSSIPNSICGGTLSGVTSPEVIPPIILFTGI